MVMSNYIIKCVTLILFIIAISSIAYAGSIYAKAELAQYLLKDAWQQVINNTVKQSTKSDKQRVNTQVKPWPWADTWPISKLSFLRLNIQQVVLAGNSGEALAFGPALANRSVAIGDVGTMVISGHRDTHFNWLQSLRIGDVVLLQDRQGVEHKYEISKRSIMHNKNDTLRQTNYTRLILVTCYPFIAQSLNTPSSNTLSSDTPWRYVVEAHPI